MGTSTRSSLLPSVGFNRHARRMHAAQARNAKYRASQEAQKYALERSKKAHRDHVKAKQEAAHKRAVLRKQNEKAAKMGLAQPHLQRRAPRHDV